MKKFLISDKSLVLFSADRSLGLSFSGRVRIAGLLDDTKTDIIELPAPAEKTDELFIKTVAATVKKSAVSVDAGCTVGGVENAYVCVAEAVRPVINVTFPLSVVQLEYLCHMKPAAALKAIADCVCAAKAKGVTVEFSAVDAGRAEKEFLYAALTQALECGADIITVSDEGSGFAFDEYGAFIAGCLENVKGLSEKTLIADISDGLHMASASLYTAIKAGIDGVRVGAGAQSCCEYARTVDFLTAKGEQLGVGLNIYTSVAKKNIAAILSVAQPSGKRDIYEVAQPSAEFSLGADTDEESFFRCVSALGYQLSDADNKAVWEAFREVAGKKTTVSAKELDAIVAGAAAQVPAAYELKSYVINSGNVITPTANIALEKNGELLTGVYVGDGPIDAAFNAIETIIGHHYELDDFQIQAVTEGRQALGKSVVCLRSSSGKLFSGTGVSADVIGASITAYINALNKIAFEEMGE